MTSAFFDSCLRDTLFAARAARARTHHRNQRVRKVPLLLVRNCKEEGIPVPLASTLEGDSTPVFEPPAFLDGRDYCGGVEAHRVNVTWVGETPEEEIAKLHNVDDLVFKFRNPTKVVYSFARLVAESRTMSLHMGLRRQRSLCYDEHLQTSPPYSEG